MDILEPWEKPPGVPTLQPWVNVSFNAILKREKISRMFTDNKISPLNKIINKLSIQWETKFTEKQFDKELKNNGPSRPLLIFTQNQDYGRILDLEWKISDQELFIKIVSLYGIDDDPVKQMYEIDQTTKLANETLAELLDYTEAYTTLCYVYLDQPIKKLYKNVLIKAVEWCKKGLEGEVEEETPRVNIIGWLADALYFNEITKDEINRLISSLREKISFMEPNINKTDK